MPATVTVHRTRIPGLLFVTIPVAEDARGWFKENWQREKMLAAGLPDFAPVQHNLSWNAARGVTRGIHAEPWDKLVSVASGRVFGAWVDMREGSSGTVVHRELGPDTAVFVPRGVGNSYQALEDGTTYSYLVNDHWQAGAAYAAAHVGDPVLAIPWPIDLTAAEMSPKDRANPFLVDADLMPARRTLVLGAGGQLGQSLLAAIPAATGLTRHDLDLSDVQAVRAFDWGAFDVVVNAAAFTDVEAAETPAGRPVAWALNAALPSELVRLADRHRFRLLHVSSDYVLDGSLPPPAEWSEDDVCAPLGVYGQSKAAGELAVLSAARHWVIRTSWVVGNGRNFVRTMTRLADEGASPRVVDDQFGRLTFADELAAAIRHLLAVDATPQLYNVSNAGPPTTWCGLARDIFAARGRDPRDVVPVSTVEHSKEKKLAPRPANSLLDLSRLRDTGFEPGDAGEALASYLAD